MTVHYKKKDGWLLYVINILTLIGIRLKNILILIMDLAQKFIAIIQIIIMLMMEESIQEGILKYKKAQKFYN